MAGTDIDSLAADVATHGIEARGDAVVRLLGEARAAGVTPLLIAIVLDPTEATVVRNRAFGRVLLELVREPVAPRQLAVVA